MPNVSTATAAVTLSLGLVLALPSIAYADASPPTTVDCSKKANKGKPECKNHYPENDELYQAAYWLVRDGAYAKAQAMLRLATQPDDTRILTLMGFTTRKLGDVETALGYYGQALAANPDYVVAREYLGEAYLQKGDLRAAEGQLGEIGSRCGTACAEYGKLNGIIGEFKVGHASGVRG